MTSPIDEEPEFEPLSRPPSLVEVVARDLRERIVFGRLRPGERISDARVAKAMNISRAPVREALAHLTAHGLVREVAGRGAFVVQLTKEDVRHIFDCRRAIEGIAARRIAEQRDVDDRVAILRSVVSEMAEVESLRDESAAVERAKIDHRFHTTLCDLTENVWLVRLYEQLADQSLLMQALDSAAHPPASTDDFVALHEPIVDAIATHDPHVAEAAIVTHIDLSERVFLNETLIADSH